MMERLLEIPDNGPDLQCRRVKQPIGVTTSPNTDLARPADRRDTLDVLLRN
jgi:hypothetical protein